MDLFVTMMERVYRLPTVVRFLANAKHHGPVLLVKNVSAIVLSSYPLSISSIQRCAAPMDLSV